MTSVVNRESNNKKRWQTECFTASVSEVFVTVRSILSASQRKNLLRWISLSKDPRNDFVLHWPAELVRVIGTKEMHITTINHCEDILRWKDESFVILSTSTEHIVIYTHGLWTKPTMTRHFVYREHSFRQSRSRLVRSSRGSHWPWSDIFLSFFLLFDIIFTCMSSSHLFVSKPRRTRDRLCMWKPCPVGTTLDHP